MGSARFRVVIVVLVLCAAGAVPVIGAVETEPAVVAADGDVTVTANDSDDGDLCVGIRAGGDLDEAYCARDQEQVGLVVVGRRQLGGRRAVAVVVPAAAVSVELRRAGLVVGNGAVVAGEAYTGKAAGRLRFALVRLAPGTPADGLRAHARDGAGTLLAAYAPRDAELVTDRHRLLTGRRGPVSWVVAEQRRSKLEPSVLDPAHETVSRCVVVAVRSPGMYDGATDCTSGAPRFRVRRDTAAVEAAHEDRCGPDFRLLHGVVDATVQRVTVLFGDGRRRTARTVALAGGERVYVLPISGDDAVRGVTLHQAGGQERFVRRSLAPVAVLCAPHAGAPWPGDSTLEFGPNGGSLIGSPGDLLAVAPTGPVTTLPGPPVARIADGPGETLCLVIGDRPFDAIGCAIPAPLPGKLLAGFDDVYVPRAFVLAVPAQVATLRFRGPDGRVALTLPTIDAAGYAGRYAGAVRFAVAGPAHPRPLSVLELLDAGGRVLARDEDPNTGAAEPRPGTPRRVVGRAGAPSLWRTQLHVGGEVHGCVALTDGARPPAGDVCEGTRASETAQLLASCATQRLTVAVALRAGTRVLADTGAAPRRMRLREGLGLLTLRAGARLRSLTFIREGTRRRVRIDAPPAARHCGWRSVLPLELDGPG